MWRRFSKRFMLRLSSAVCLISPLFVVSECNGSGGLAPTIASVSGSVSGPCDVFTGGCAEAFSVTRAMTSSYTGPLFQLQRISSGAALDIDQNPSTQAADMTTWSAFCSGVASNCAYKKIYAQIQIGANDLVPSTFVTNWTDCSAGGITCAAPFAIEAATGLPITNLVAPYGYTIAADASAVGITAGTNPNSIMLNGKAGPAGTSTVGGTFGLSHQWDTGNVSNTIHEIGIAWGRAGNLLCGTPMRGVRIQITKDKALLAPIFIRRKALF